MNSPGMAISMTAGRTALLTMSERGRTIGDIYKARWDLLQMSGCRFIHLQDVLQGPCAYGVIGWLGQVGQAT